MDKPLDLQAEAARWRASALPRDTLIAALDHLIAAATEAHEEERLLVSALRRELVYSLCWPGEPGGESVVSRAYMLIGPAGFPTPGDPEPVRQSLESHEEHLGSLSALLSQAVELRSML